MCSWRGSRKDRAASPGETTRQAAVDIRWWMVVALLAGTGVCLRPFFFATSQQRLLWQAADLLAREQYDEAERSARAVLDQAPHSATALLIAGEALASGTCPDEALPFLLRVPAASSAEYVRPSIVQRSV